MDACSAIECHTPCLPLVAALARHADARVRCAAAEALLPLAKRLSAVDPPAIASTIVSITRRERERERESARARARACVCVCVCVCL
jgi:hypothetical protein